MSTTKRRLTISVSEELYNDIIDSPFVSQYTNVSKKIVRLVEIALNTDSNKISRTEQIFLEQFRQLDSLGKEAVRTIISTELSRIEDDRRIIEMPEPKVIPLYLSPAAAGFASPIVGEEFDYYELQETDPQGAVFALKISGDSMEPWFRDQSIVFCNKDSLANGDIGVFCVNGDSFIKQYYYDRWLHITYLFSLNRERANADVVIPPDSNFSFICLGRVITNRHFPLPGDR